MRGLKSEGKGSLLSRSSSKSLSVTSWADLGDLIRKMRKETFKNTSKMYENIGKESEGVDKRKQ